MTDHRQKFLDSADSLREKADRDGTTAADAAGFAQAALTLVQAAATLPDAD